MKYISFAALAVALVALGVVYLTPAPQPSPPFQASSGTEHYNQENFYGGFTVGNANYNVEASRNCGSATWNPGAVTSSTVATTTVNILGYTFGDVLYYGFSATTTDSTTNVSLDLGVVGSSSGSTTTIATLSLPVSANTSINAPTGTLKVCFVH